MEIISIKKYELTEEEKKAIEETVAILRTLDDFDEEFIDRKDTYLGNVIADLKSVLDMDGVDWNDWH